MKDPNALRTIGEVSQIINVPVYVIRFWEKKFDLILADPPYGKEYLVNILEFVTRNDLLKSDGILVIEDDVRSELELNNNFKLIEKKKLW